MMTATITAIPATAGNPTRRRLLAALAAVPAAFYTPARAQDSGPVRIAQSIALSGPLGELGQAMHQAPRPASRASTPKAA